MQISENWLREWVNPTQLSTQQLGHQLTMAGLEVDALQAIAPPFTGVFVGQVLSVEPHPQADRLRVTRVTVGQAEDLQIVCGAANVRVGLKVAVATLGAVLPNDFAIKRAKLRGVESLGMLCAAQELGLSPATDGLLELAADAPVGMDIRDYLELNDYTMEFGITPNRGDCLSVLGMAREVSAFNRLPLTTPAMLPVTATIADVVTVELQSDACPRYVGRIIKGIRPNATSPAWLVRKLARSGIASLGAIVDVTNYVLIELGQPMHAFDLAKIQGGIVVRQAQAGEQLTLLNQQTIALRSDSLVIADHQQALALAGIMGGNDSAVSDSTVDIFLESAFFQPLALAGKARSYGLHTDSSHRFERGVDFNLARQAIERATQLILEIAGGDAGTVIEVTREHALPQRLAIMLRAAKVTQVLGFQLSAEQVVDMLTALGMTVVSHEQGWLVTAPSYRFDISIEADLIEELARVYGYDNLPIQQPHMAFSLEPQAEAVSTQRIKELLVALNYQEAITFSFVDPKLQQILDPQAPTLSLANPLSSELSTMRTTLWAGLLSAVAHNQNRQQARVRLFEIGSRFLPQADGSLQQEQMLAGVITGDLLTEAWSNKSQAIDFFDIKGNVESILALTGTSDTVRFKAAQHPALHTGQTAALVDSQNQTLGYVGKLHPQVQQKLDLQGAVYVFEVALASLLNAKLPKFRELSRFPNLRRDIAVVLDAAIPAADVLQTARQAGSELLQNVWLFDVYQGTGISEGKRSLAIGTLWQHQERTLQDEEVKAGVQAIVDALERQHQAVLR
ncbi:phenylalanine--tRNA ligase subunit beta [Agitococcus lubricus]|uniref:Phenylalanine--tRNA ligase beta subunit n=1 Tax=Agitococcus lubricus TaxID=1077255 RepID=A0A2T5J205_9GAMM|nr:phenylalanine--tRNA ligase subunit beta [Agitococcus lubricus]PTQ90476.1 phenylalanyl-tRNA synthetase beta subunit [Agitococcus lubricus]